MWKSARKAFSAAPTLESLLVDAQILNSDQWDSAHRFMAENDCNLATAVLFLKFIEASALAKLLKSQRSVQWLHAEHVPISLALKRAIPIEKAKLWQVFAINQVQDNGLRLMVVAMTDPLNLDVITKVEKIVKMKVQPVFISLEDLQQLYQRHFKTGLKLFTPELSAFHEVTSKRRVESVKSSGTERSNQTETIRFRALVSLLLKKGVFTLEEFQREIEMQ